MKTEESPQQANVTVQAGIELHIRYPMPPRNIEYCKGMHDHLYSHHRKRIAYFYGAGIDTEGPDNEGLWHEVVRAAELERLHREAHKIILNKGFRCITPISETQLSGKSEYEWGGFGGIGLLCDAHLTCFPEETTYSYKRNRVASLNREEKWEGKEGHLELIIQVAEKIDENNIRKLTQAIEQMKRLSPGTLNY